VKGGTEIKRAQSIPVAGIECPAEIFYSVINKIIKFSNGF
jgi:hypothetical protein